MREQLGTLAVLWALLLAGSSAHAASQVPAPEDRLAPMLDTLGRVSALYRDRALSFTAVERIHVTRYRSQDRIDDRRSYRFDYFYVFDDSTPETVDSLAAGLRDYRADIDQRGDADAAPVDLMSLGIPAALSRAYSWIFIFQPGLRDAFIFIQEPDDEALGRDAWVIGFSPRRPYYAGLNDWFGRVWVDKENFQLLRAEAATSPDVVSRQDPRQRLDASDAEPRTAAGGNGLAGNNLGELAPAGEVLFAHAAVEFGEVKNGLRFPTRSELVAAYIDIGDGTDSAYRQAVAQVLERGVRRDRVFRVEQRYDDYRFFGVHTSTDVDDTLRGVRRDP